MYLFIAFCSLSCAAPKAGLHTQYYDSLNTSVTRAVPAPLPSLQVWTADKDQFLKIINDYKITNEERRVRLNNAAGAFIIGGTGIGLGGGVYGLFTEDEPKGAALTSMVAGALTGIAASLNVYKRAERAKVCANFLNEVYADFGGWWGPVMHPQTDDDLKKYLQAKKDILDQLKVMKCYGIE